MTLRDLTQRHYEFIWNDPYNYFNQYFPHWDQLPESAKMEWEKKVEEIREVKLEDEYIS